MTRDEMKSRDHVIFGTCGVGVVAKWDAHRQCYVPEPGRKDELAAQLGSGWQWDDYYGGFFGPPAAEEPKAEAPELQSDASGYVWFTTTMPLEVNEWQPVTMKTVPQLDSWYDGSGLAYDGSEALLDEQGRIWVKHWFGRDGERFDSHIGAVGYEQRRDA